MVRITLDNINPGVIPTEGWKVRYRIKGSSNPFTIAGPFMAMPIIIDTLDPGGTLYEGYISRDCGALESNELYWETPCVCPDTFLIAPDGTSCRKTDNIPPTVTNSGYCLAASTNSAYSNFETRVYNPGFTNATIMLPPASVNPLIFGRSTTIGQWANPAASSVLGPLNREGVWIDSNCDGAKNSLSPGVETTVAFTYNNIGPTRTVYVGVAADNSFRVIVNGVEVANTGPTISSQIPFKIWHVIPITIRTGVNYINAIGRGSGTVEDSLGMVVYDNTAAQILAATNDNQLSILFRTSSLRGHSFDVATCPENYSLDTSGGTGNYICTRVLTSICNPAA